MNSRCYQEMSIVVREPVQYNHGMGTPPGQQVSPIINPGQSLTNKARLAVFRRRFPNILCPPGRPNAIEHSSFLRRLTDAGGRRPDRPAHRPQVTMIGEAARKLYD